MGCGASSKLKAEEEAAKKKTEEEAMKKKAEEEVATKNAEEEAAKKTAEEEAAKKQAAEEEAAKKRAEEEAAEAEARRKAEKEEAMAKYKAQFLGKPYQDCKNTYFSDLLKRECLAVVKASYFHKCRKDRVPFQDRVNIPKEYFFSGEEVVDLWTKYGARFLVIASYSWLSQIHPDPNCYHLKRLDRALTELEALNKGYEKDGHGAPEECGVILDFCSLWQKHGKEETRTALQVEQFQEGLTEINTPYGHQEVTAIKLVSVPPEEMRTYDDRGWTLFESIIIDGKGSSPALMKASPFWGSLNVITLGGDFDPDTEGKKAYDVIDKSLNAYDFISKYAKASRRPPLSPQRFGNEMKMREARAKERGVKLFTNGKDQPFVLNRYEKAFEELVATEQFVFIGMQWGPEEMTVLAEVLPCCHGLKTLNLSTNALGDLGAEKLAAGLSTLTSLKTLDLGGNKIGDTGAEKLAAGLCHLTSLTGLTLLNNNIGDTGAEKLVAGLSTLTSLTYLSLVNNKLKATYKRDTKLWAALPSCRIDLF